MKDEESASKIEGVNVNFRMLYKSVEHAIVFNLFSISFLYPISIALPKTLYGQTEAYGQLIKCVFFMYSSLVKNI